MGGDLVTKRSELFARECRVADLGLLQAEHVGPDAPQPVDDAGHACGERVHVPGGDPHPPRMAGPGCRRQTATDDSTLPEASRKSCPVSELPPPRMRASPDPLRDTQPPVDDAGARRSTLRRAVSSVAVDVSPLRDNRDFRLLFLAQRE